MKRNEKLTWYLIGGILAGMALEWFMSGTYRTHGAIRNIFVGIQLLIGAFLIGYPHFTKR